jgi:hypothetical protein
MSFLYPVFLSALAVLLIPLLVHLFRFRKYQTVRFTRVRLLKEVEIETKNQNRLKHLITLLCRILAFTFLVMAFAIPGCNNNSTQTTGKTRVSIFIDNSFSMDNRRDGQILLETAKQHAREIVRSYGVNGEFQIRTSQISGPSSQFVSSAEAVSYIDAIKIQPGSLVLETLLKSMANDLKEAGNAHAGYVISDFQLGFVGKPSNVSELKGIPVKLVKITSSPRENIGIDSAWLAKPFLIPGEKNSIQFRVANYTKEPLQDFPVKLYAESGLLGTGRVSVMPGTSDIGSIDFTGENKRYNPGRLQIDEPGASFDNVLYVNLSAQTSRNINISSSNRFVNQVIEPQPFLKITPAVNPFSGQAATANDVYIWVGPGNFSKTQAENVRDWLSASGATCIVAADINTPNDAMVNVVGFPDSKSESTSLRISEKGFTHPFFEGVFRQIPKNMAVPEIKKYRSTSGLNGAGEAILTLENGDPFLLRLKVGKGTLYFFMSPFQEDAGNFVKSPLFLPLLTHAMIAENANPQLYGICLSKTVLPLQNALKYNDKPPVLKLNNWESVAEMSMMPNGQGLYLGTQPENAGNYTLLESGSAKILGSVSVNDSRLESNPNMVLESSLKPWMEANGIQWTSGDNAVAAYQAKISDTSLWRLFIWLAAVFFALEVLVLVFWDYRFIKKRKSE